MSRRRKLPPLTALMAFEASARWASFTKAAEELGVTQAAVSRQIHLLEEYLGFPVFSRLHRRVELTEKGRTLARASKDAFDQIAVTVAEISTEGRSGELTISATVAFSQFWLLPRISEFSRLHPNANLRIVTQDKPGDIDRDGLDLAIRFGNGLWSDGQSEPLFEDEIFPVCSPEYAANAPRIDTPHNLVSHPLISNDTDDPTWIGWKEWLAAFSVEFPKKSFGLRCSFYTEAIYAALSGQGIALGWRRLVEELLAQKRLVRVTDAMLNTRSAYFVVVPKRQRHNESSQQFLQWLKTKAENESRDR